MAACLVTYTGSGLVEINYKIATVPYTIRSNGGPLFIDDAATDVTYTTLTGDIIATSLCLTITDLPFTYYKIGWKDIKAEGHHIVGVLLNNSEEIEIDFIVDFPESGIDLARSINGEVDDRFKIRAYRRTSTGYGNTLLIQYDYILKTIGATSISLVVSNDDGEQMLLVGELYDIGDLTPDYKIVSECYPSTVLI